MRGPEDAARAGTAVDDPATTGAEPLDEALPDVDGLEAEAAEVLPDHVVGYFRGPTGAYGIATDADRWSQVRFRPHVLRDTSGLGLATTVLGTPVASPVLVAPMAQQRAAHPDGEVATARAVGRRGTLLGVSSNTGVRFADIDAVGAPWWFQVYVMDDREATAELVTRAAQAGARALVLTVDTPGVDPRRPRFEPRSWPERYGMQVNIPGGEDGRRVFRGTRDLSVRDIGWLRELTGLPVVVKGVLRGDDARACVDAGAVGVVVSTHGGRCLNQTVRSADALPEVVAAVGDQAEVYVDSGLRTPEHVAAALCLGARAVFLGRPVLWALATGGDRRVEQLLEGFETQLERVLRSLGVNALAELGPDLVV
ncbi:alpha-hydroxy acid oxidase [Microlunatus flavus]|uniref:4-hydroxymandelate oxidase n=1 Tax=Microlunatus flavus TaxID=1036181 RepID=A0A1H9LUM9_9ACTN|nr:alpha-hydroxy acid oxidase [Microlunatus flavus]SER14927.1 4-hydroxymandelate oxidase [Microlunatus flavus]